MTADAIKPKVVGLGAGGHAKVVQEVLRFSGRFELYGLLDRDPRKHGSAFCGLPVLGDDNLLPELHTRHGVTLFFVGLGMTSDSRPRRELFELALRCGLEPVTAIHPAAIVSPSARLDRGVTILAGAIVSSDAAVGDNVIVNTGAIVEHDCEVGAHAHVATGAVLCGGVRVGQGSHIGAGATVRQYLTIGDRAIVAAGAMVIRDVAAGDLVMGVPARGRG